MADLLHASTWFRDEAQRRRAQEAIRDRLADERNQDECRYLLRLCWQLAMSYREVSHDELLEHVRPEKLAWVDALMEAADRGPEAIDAWIDRCEGELPFLFGTDERDEA